MTHVSLFVFHNNAINPWKKALLDLIPTLSTYGPIINTHLPTIELATRGFDSVHIQLRT